MDALAERWTQPGSVILDEFERLGRYTASMGCLIYLSEKSPYRAVRLNSYQEVLIHAHENRPIGVKLKDIIYLHNRLQAVFRTAKGFYVNPKQIVLAALWEIALTAGGYERVADAEVERHEALARRARREIVDLAAPLSMDELDLAA